MEIVFGLIIEARIKEGPDSIFHLYADMCGRLNSATITYVPLLFFYHHISGFLFFFLRPHLYNSYIRRWRVVYQKLLSLYNNFVYDC